MIWFSFLTTISVAQLICHAIGDYPLQSPWMADFKTQRWTPAVCHALLYSAVFVVVMKPSLVAWSVIAGTHLVIDRFRLARYVCWASSHLSPIRPPPFSQCAKYGYPPHIPEWTAFWLLVIVDNLTHVTINGWALATL